MKILVVEYGSAKVLTLECQSTDTIAHLKAKLDKIEGYLMFDGKLLGDNLSENMTLADVGIQDGSLTLFDKYPDEHSDEYPDEYSDLLFREPPESSPRRPDLADAGVHDGSLILDSSVEFLVRPRRRPEKNCLHYADAFKYGWREEHAKALLQLLLELCQDGTISEGNVTDEAWLTIQNSLKNSMQYCSFQIDFLKERLHDYKQLYSVLTETISSSIFEWDRESKTISLNTLDWKEEYPELLLLCGWDIPYFDTLEKVCLSVNTTRSSEQRVSETSTNIHNAREASSSRGEICIRCPSDSNLSPIGSSTSIGKENGYLWSTMKILVVDETAKVFSLECESTDTIVHLKAKLKKITGISIRGRILRFDGKLLDYPFEENRTLADVGVQDGSLILLCFPPPPVPCGGIFEMSRRRPEKDYLYYADVFKSGWREEHAKALLHLLLELCQDGTISDGNVTDEAWLRTQNSLKKSIKCTFQIDFLKERLRDYKELYSVLAKTSSWIFDWDHERKTITIISNDWRVQYPVLLLLCGPHIPYFDTLEKVCLFLNTGQSSEQRVSESSTNISTMHAKLRRWFYM